MSSSELSVTLLGRRGFALHILCLVVEPHILIIGIARDSQDLTDFRDGARGIVLEGKGGFLLVRVQNTFGTPTFSSPRPRRRRGLTIIGTKTYAKEARSLLVL